MNIISFIVAVSIISPSIAQSEEPTYSPTAWPTRFPTDLPTQWPTLFPSMKPTEEPTYSPTAWPTRFPTDLPTQGPTTISPLIQIDTLIGVDIGSVGVGGGSIVTDDKIEVNGGGSDIWGSSDAFHFLHKTSNEDVSIEMFVEDLTGSAIHGWAKGGLMFRDSLAADSKHFSLFVTGSNGLANQWRSNSGGSSFNYHSTDTASRNVWLKITKTGNKLQAYYKTGENNNWSPFGSERTISFSGKFYYGVAVTSHDNTKIAELIGNNFNERSPPEKMRLRRRSV